MGNKTKQFRPLEKELLSSLVGPDESEERMRYVKRWVYGESLPQKTIVPIRNESKDKTKFSILERLHSIITGDEQVI